MKNIVLCCAAGMSTSMLVQRMKDAAQKKGVDVTIKAVAARQSKRDTLTTNIGSRLFAFVIVIYMSDAGNRLYRVEIPTS